MPSCSITCSCFCYGTLLSCPATRSCLGAEHLAIVLSFMLYLATAPCCRAIHALRQAPCHRAHYLALIFRCDTLLSCPITCSCVTIKHLALVLTSMLLPFGNGTILSCPFCVLSLKDRHRAIVTSLAHLPSPSISLSRTAACLCSCNHSPLLLGYATRHVILPIR